MQYTSAGLTSDCMVQHPDVNTDEEVTLLGMLSIHCTTQTAERCWLSRWVVTNFRLKGSRFHCTCGKVSVNELIRYTVSLTWRWWAEILKQSRRSETCEFRVSSQRSHMKLIRYQHIWNFCLCTCELDLVWHRYSISCSNKMLFCKMMIVHCVMHREGSFTTSWWIQIQVLRLLPRELNSA